MNHRAIAMMFICPSVTGMHRDHTVHFSVDLSLLLDSPCSGHPDTKACPPTPNHLSPVLPGREVECGCTN